MLVMLSSVTTRKTPGMRMTHHELRRSARSANANMLPHESTVSYTHLTLPTTPYV